MSRRVLRAEVNEKDKPLEGDEHVSHGDLNNDRSRAAGEPLAPEVLSLCSKSMIINFGPSLSMPDAIGFLGYHL
jgi:hypothetical protein